MTDELWAVLIQGPDEMYAVQSKEQGEVIVKRMNDTWKAMPEGFGDRQRPPGYAMHAIVTPWIHSAESHARDLMESAI